MDEQPIIPPSQTKAPLTFFTKNKRVLIIILSIIVTAIVVLGGMMIYKKYINITKAPAIDERFLSIPSKNDSILDSYPKKIESGVIYFYKYTTYGQEGKIASYLEGKIVNIDKKQKSLSINAANGTDKILITTKDYSAVKSFKFNESFKPNVRDIHFDDLIIGDIVSVSNLKYDGQSYVAGAIVKKE